MGKKALTHSSFLKFQLSRLPEVELLLCCARTRLEPEQSSRIKALLHGKIDWDDLISSALVNGVMPLLYWNLNAVCPEALPRTTLNRLHNLFNSNLQRNLFLTGELYRILDLFEANRVAAIPFKGPALAASIYGNLGFRQFSDLDILVKKQDVQRAGELLHSLEYRPQFQLTGSQFTAYLRSQCELLFSRENGRIIAEVHWEIAPDYFLPPGMTRRLSEYFDLRVDAGSRFLTLPPEETLLVLCVHGTKHLWERLIWITDIAEVLRVHKDLNWGYVMERARTLGSERMLYLGLFLANDFLGAALPMDVAQPVRADPVVQQLAEGVRQRFLRQPDGPPGLLESCRFHLMAQERLQDRIRYCVRQVLTPTPTDWASLPLPGFLFPLYYLLRPIRLAAKYGFRPVRRLYDDGERSTISSLRYIER